MIELIKNKVKNSSILIQCLITSVLLHCMLLYLFYKHPLMLYSKSIFQRANPSPTAVMSKEMSEASRQDEILRQVFENLTIEPKQVKAPYDLAALPTAQPLSPKQESPLNIMPDGMELSSIEIDEPDATDVSISSRIFTTEEMVDDLSSSEVVEVPNLAPDDLSSILKNSIETTAIDAPVLSFVDRVEAEFEPDYLESGDKIYTPALETEISTSNMPKSQDDLNLVKAPSELIRVPTHIGLWSKTDIDTSIEDKTDKKALSPDLFIPYSQPGLSSLDTENILEVVSIENWNDYFDTKVSISSPDEENGYVFSITLKPSIEVARERMSQNFYFIIDASASIDRHKFSLFKRSVLKALSALEPSDRFNIIVLDKKLTRLSPKNLVFNLKSVHMAEDFLEKLSQANFITSIDLLESLEKVSELIEESPQMHTALLLTNGQSSEGFQAQQNRIRSFIQKNDGKLSLYGAAVGGKNNLVNLDMLCSVSGGKLLYSDTNAAFPRKVTNLVKSLKTPLAKDVKITAVASSPKAGLSILTTKQTLPALYAGEPYTIIGKMDRLCDLHLTLEARHEDEWITVEKEISFQTAEVSRSLSNEWQKAEVATCYESFLKEPKPKHLKAAREHLEKQHGKAAAQ